MVQVVRDRDQDTLGKGLHWVEWAMARRGDRGVLASLARITPLRRQRVRRKLARSKGVLTQWGRVGVS